MTQHLQWHLRYYYSWIEDAAPSITTWPSLSKRLKILVLNSQCGKFSIFLSLRFYVKSILENVKVEKVPFLQFQGFRFLIWVSFNLRKMQKFIKKSLKLISWKIWGTENFWNFHTVMLNLIINDTDYIIHAILDTLLCVQKICPFLILVAVHYKVWKFMDFSSTQILRET